MNNRLTHRKRTPRFSVRPGNRIKIKGEYFKVTKVISQKINLSDTWADPFAEICFIDSRGEEHHWQSWVESGEIITDIRRIPFSADTWRSQRHDTRATA